jgi:YD repeat-containing protein
VTDSHGSQDLKEVEIVVANVNRLPSLAVKPQIVALGEELEFTLFGKDPDAETTLTYSSSNLPEGATLNAETGLVKWQPSPGQVGDYVVTYQVSDGKDTVEKNTLIRVEVEPTLPVVNLEFTPSFAPIPGQKVTINALADSFTEIKELKVLVNGQELALDSRNRGSYTPSQPGRVEIEVTATDAAGRTATTTEILKVRDPQDNDKPVVAFGLGLNGEAFDRATDIKATISDRNLDEWTLALKGEDEVLATGYGNVNNNVIAKLDPALYSNGFYTLELTATDIKGRTSTTEIIVEVEGDDKKAQYQRVDTDLSLDFNGTTIDLTRRYDSPKRNESGSFGNGWASSWNFDLETDVEIRGTGNEAVKPFETGTRLYLTLPDGERVGFTFQPVAEEITGLTYYHPAWVADAGVNYTLESTDVLLSKAGDRFYDLQTAKPYNPSALSASSAYTLTDSDGTVYQLNAEGVLQEQVTSNGTRLIYSDSGILNPESGEMVRFESDEAGRLTNITAPNGTSVIYDYDEAGNLISVRNLSLGDSVRYSYGEKGLNLIAGDTGEAVAYFDTPVVKPITKDLGTASSFTGKTITGSSPTANLYSFALRESELKSTNTGFVLLGVDTGSNEMPVIEGLTPVSSTDGFALFAIDREGLNLLSVNGDYELQLGIAGDVNNDNAVNGVDSQLVTDAIGKSAGDAGYDRTLDLNRDRTIDATDLQILGSNYGFRYNQAPVVTDGEAITHEDLSVEIPLKDLANDPEGDKPYGMASQRIFFKATDVQHGQVIFTPDGSRAIFKPYVGYTGTASFKLFADDGYGVSDAAVVSIQVSDAPLTSLDFVERNPQLEVGEQVELQVVADFADQEDVVLPGDYLTWRTEKTGVATISDRGTVTGVSNGTTIFSVERNGLSAVTASRVGQTEIPGTEAELNTAIAQYFGLDVYPDAVTLTKDVERQILVGIEGQTDSPDLSDDTTGTRYFVNNPEVIGVDEDGLITTLMEGEAEVTVIHGGVESIIPVNVETSNLGATELDADGGIVENSEGYQVMIPEGALAQKAEINITSIEQSELTAPLPEKFEVIGAFNLELGDEDLAIPAQIAIPAPEGLAPGTEVFLMRDGELPDATGTWNPIWLVQESAIVGDDGMIRTSSPPWPGIKKGDDYIVSVPKFEYKVGKTYGGFGTYTGASNLAGTAVVTSGVGVLASNFSAIFSIPTFFEANLRTVEVITIPKIGSLPKITTAGVSINPQGVPSATVELDTPYFKDNNPFLAPALEKGKIDFSETEEPVVYLTGTNFLIDGENTNVSETTFADLTPIFEYAGKEYEGEVISDLSKTLGGNRYQIAIKVPQTVVLSESAISLTRTQMELTDASNPNSIKPVPYKSESKITISPQDVDLTLAPQAFKDRVSVFNALNPEEILETGDLTSRDLLLAEIPVGTGGTFDDEPRDLAATHDATRAYVSLRDSGKLALIDLMSLQQVDTNSETPNVIDQIKLPVNAAPHAIVISPDDRYAYVGDYRSETLYIVDIDAKSTTYHQVIEVINLAGVENGLRSLAISEDGRKLFASAPTSNSRAGEGKVYVFNIDPQDQPKELKDQPGEFEPNTQKWHEIIGTVEVEKGIEGISASPDPHVMVFTNRFEDYKGFGRIKVTNDDPTKFAASVSYTPLGLGSAQDYFDVNEARDVVITSDGKYGFVAGANSRNMGSGIPSIDGPKAGSNVGIIVDPLTENAKLVAATRPIPNAWTSSITISGDDKYLFASYPGVGGVYAWSVEEIIKTLDDPSGNVIDHLGRGIASPVFNPATKRIATKADLSSVPIDNINPKITIASDLQLIKDKYTRFNGLEYVNDVEFGVPEESKRAPLTIGFNPWSVANATRRNWLNLLPVDEDDITQDLTPTLEWEFDKEYEDVKEVNLFVSSTPKNQGLLPWDQLADLKDPTLLPELSVAQKKKLLTEPWGEFDDFNPGRIITATWKKDTKTWYWRDGETVIASTPGNPPNSKTRLTIPDELALTLGEDYYWAVQATAATGEVNLDTSGEFETVAPINDRPFSSVTVITHGFNLIPFPGEHEGIPESSYQMAEKIVGIHGEDKEGLILRYDKPTGNWVPVQKDEVFGWRDNTDLTNGLKPEEPGYMKLLGNVINTQYQHRPIILLTEWSTNGESTVPDSGFTEGAADAFFASMVELDRVLKVKVGDDVSPGDGIYKDNGDLRREQGNLFNSPMHFIGFSRGTVVNSEIIQRLGTYYPLAGGFEADENGKRIENTGDLQMTTIDPHDFAQEGLNIPVGELFDKALALSKNLAKDPLTRKIAEEILKYASKISRFSREDLDYSDFQEPRVQVWDNVSFADNYYQTTNTGNPLNLTPNGRELVNINPSPYSNAADVNLDLSDFRGFKGIEAVVKYPIGGAHSATLAWYTGTVDQALTSIDNEFVYEEDGIEIQNQKGEVNLDKWYDSQLDVNAPLWYSSGNNPNDTPDEYDSEEGIGTGWYYSYLNGGERPDGRRSTVTPAFDNTFAPRQRGDFAVPTLFNGNFDTSFSGNEESFRSNTVRNAWGGAIAGWSYHNGRLDQFDVGSFGDLKYGVSIKNLVDWKSIHTLSDDYRSQVGYSETQPNFALKMDGGDSIVHNRFVVPDWGALRFDLHTPNINGGQLQVTLQAADGSAAGVSTAIFLEPAINSALAYSENTRKIGYGTQGFETFTLDIPDNLRGKTAILSFQLDGGNPIYLDDVFFQSKDLMLGLPTLNEQKPRTDLSFADNFLIEKPQYSLSYNQDKKGSNWVSWQVNPSWLGNVSRPGAEEARLDTDYPYGETDYPWISDPTLPSGLTTTIPTDYRADSSYDRGHLIPVRDRDRSVKDILSTFLTTNLLPQHFKVNQSGGSWFKLEEFTDKVAERGWNLYITAGGAGTIPNSPLEQVHGINTPESIWQVIVALKPGERIENIDIDTPIIAVNIPNERPVPIPDDPDSPDPTKWYTWITTINEIEASTGLDLLSNLPDELEKQIEQTSYTGSVSPTGFPIIPFSGSLLAEESNSPVSSIGESSITQDSTTNSGIIDSSRKKNRGFTQINTGQISSIQARFTPKLSFLYTGISQVGATQGTVLKARPTEIGSYQDSIIESSIMEDSTTKVSTTKIGSFPSSHRKIGVTQIDPTQVAVTEVKPSQGDSTKISFTSSVPSEQFFSSHNSTPQIINEINNSAIKIWSNLLKSETSLDVDFQITDLPSGQLAEATIIGFDSSGVPNAGTILIDRDANGVGWFIDETPLDNSEFTTKNTDSYLLAAAESEANGKYDLLTTVLHELSHLYGFIDGYQGYDDRLSTKNGTTKFIGDDFTATLDGEHLDKQTHPYDLLNTHLAPGMRKLPSELDVQILQSLIATEFERNGNKPAGEELLAKLTSAPLLGITNGDFSISDTTNNTYAWNTRGDSKIESGQAVLTEDSPFLSNFSQTFTVTESAKTIQFKLIETELGASELAPPDAFEVALLDANTHESLVTDNDLTETDSLLNIQNDGTAYFSDQVRIGGATSGELINLDKSRTVTIDISNLTPGTEATLYFDLLGFGDVDSRVVIDDVRLSDQNLLPPTAVDDTATTIQGEAKVIEILANDSDDDGTITPESVQVRTGLGTWGFGDLGGATAHGTVRVNQDGTVTYTPSDRFVGKDSFTYVVQDNDGQPSEPATVTVEVKNAAPKITEINIPDRITEGDEVTLKAIATDAGSDELTYTWDFGDGETATGTDSHITHTFTKNGDYKLMRIRSNCCLWSKPTSYSGIGKPKKHDRKFKVNDQSNFLNLV